MELASLAFIDAITSEINLKERVAVVCGFGNNGGDGFAIARILLGKGYDISTFSFEDSGHRSTDNEINLKRLKKVNFTNEVTDFSSFDIIIDGIFGSGLSRDIEGKAKKIIQEINKSDARVISIDIPSGWYSDSINTTGAKIHADLVISFQRPKLTFFMPESNAFISEWKVVDIGLKEEFIQRQNSSHFLLDEHVRLLLKSRKRFSHKGTYGHALIISGSKGKMGAAVLCTRACLRSGVGLATSLVPSCGYNIIQSSVPEAMCIVDPEEDHISKIPDNHRYHAVGIGPGLGMKFETEAALKQFLTNHQHPMVIDADALNLIARNPTLLEEIPACSILTPHPKEFERLAGKSSNSLDRLEKQKVFSSKHGCIVVLKDAHTIITSPDGCAYFNTTGNPGMSTAGSGDVLTGIITGLLAQRYLPLEAAIIGVYFHGKAGDAAAEKRGMNGVIAGDIIEELKIS